MDASLRSRVARALSLLSATALVSAAGCGSESNSSLAKTGGSSGAGGAGAPEGGTSAASGGNGKPGAGGTTPNQGGVFASGGGSGTSGAAGMSGAGGAASSGTGGNAASGSGALGGGGAVNGTGGTSKGGGGAVSGAGGALATGGAGAASGAGGAGLDRGGGPNSAGSSGQAAGGASSALGCSARNYLLCEDFESTAVGSTPKGWTRHGDLAGVADDAAKGGTHSLKLQAAPAAERRIYHEAAALGSAHWGRIFYKVQQPVPNAFVHSTLVSFTGDAPMHGAAEFRVIDTVKQAVDTRDVGSLHQYLYNVQVTGGSEFSREGPYDQKFEDAWHCVEYQIDAATQSYNLYIDGKEEIGFKDGAGNYAKSDIPPAFKELRVGWVNYQQAAPGFTAWIDEIAFDDERIGCE